MVHREKALNLQLAISQYSLVPTVLFRQCSVAVLQPPPRLASEVYWSDPTNLKRDLKKKIFSAQLVQKQTGILSECSLSRALEESNNKAYTNSHLSSLLPAEANMNVKSHTAAVSRCVGPWLTLSRKSRDFHYRDLLLSFSPVHQFLVGGVRSKHLGHAF